MENNGTQGNSDCKGFIEGFLNDLIDQINFKSYSRGIMCKNEAKEEDFYTEYMYLDKYEMKIVKVKKQNGGALCGFHCLYNIKYFLRFLKSISSDKLNTNANNNSPNKYYYLLKLSSYTKFWQFYLKVINNLLQSPIVEDFEKPSLISLGPLERNQFSFLLDTFDLPVKLNLDKSVRSDESNRIKFLNFFYAFEYFQEGMEKDEILTFQEDLIYFAEYKGDQKLIYVILLGVTNHWSVLILTNIKGSKEKFYLDSDSEGVGFLELFRNQINPEERILKFAEQAFEEMRRHNQDVSPWTQKCYIQWLKDINFTLSSIFQLTDLPVDNPNLFMNIYIKKSLDNFILSFTDFNQLAIEQDTITSLSLEEDFFKLLEIKERLFTWITQEYHPKTIKEDIIPLCKSLDGENWEITGKLRIMIEIIEILKEKINNIEIGDEYSELFSRFFIVIEDLQSLLSNI